MSNTSSSFITAKQLETIQELEKLCNDQRIRLDTLSKLVRAHEIRIAQLERAHQQVLNVLGDTPDDPDDLDYENGSEDFDAEENMNP